MIFFVYSTETDQSIGSSLGQADYSYFFVMKKFLPILEGLGKVIVVSDPSAVDTQFDAEQALGNKAILLSFTPPHKTPTGLRCPTFPVFAWEYSTIPNEAWGSNPRHNWAAVLSSLPGAITHSHFTVDSVRAAVGTRFPAISLPAPLWDEYAPLYRAMHAPAAQGNAWELEVENGVVLDSHAQGLQKPGFNPQTSFDARPHSIRLSGIIYTSVFNPNDGRKNWLDLLSGFCFAFRDNPDVTLLMKLAHHDAALACGMLWHEMKKLAPYQCRVIAVQGFLEAAAYRQLVANTTYIVNSAHGEGQCLPLMEFMSAGKPAIAPNHTAMADYVDEKNSFIVESGEEWTHWPHDPRLVLRTFRYRINWESLRDAYLESYRVATEQPNQYATMSMQATRMLGQHCGQKVIGKQLQGFLVKLGFLPAPWPLLEYCRNIYRFVARSLIRR